MTQTFTEKWLEAVENKGSVLCAGVDPAEFAMGRGSKGLPEGVAKRDFVLPYIEAVAPYCPAIKPNLQYMQAPGKTVRGMRIGQSLEGDMELLSEVGELAHSLGLIVIEDKKLADIGETNEAGMFYAGKRADAVTLALYAGNMGEAPAQLEKWGVGGIHMCLMTNPEYATQKNKLVPLTEEQEQTYDPQDIIRVTIDGQEIPHVRQYQQLAHDARHFGLEGLVIGTTKHITPQEIKKARYYSGPNILALMPGIGEQGGEAEIIYKYFTGDNVIVNVARSLMFPNNNNKASKQEHAAKAKYYMDTLNQLRAAA